MDSRIEKSAHSSLVIQRNLFLSLSFFLVVVVVCLSVVAIRKETITLFKSPAVKVDPSALEDQAHYLAHLILNRSPSTWQAQNVALVDWLTPSFKIPFGAYLGEWKESLIKEKKGFEWELKDSSVEMISNKRARVFVSGELSSYIPTHNGNKQLVEKKTKDYLLDFVIVEGKPLLNNFEKQEGESV